MWSKPIGSFTNEDPAMCLRQTIAVSHLLPIAKQRVEKGIDDDTEMYDGELAAAIAQAEYHAKCESEHLRICDLARHLEIKMPNHSTEPSPRSGTSAAEHPPRQP